MHARTAVAQKVLVLLMFAWPALAQGPVGPSELPRGIRRDIPLTNSIRRAHAAGTRDRTGRPGANYWQLQTDFNIKARLDRASKSIFGEETIVIHNNSPDALDEIVLRLDHNIFRATVPRGSSVPAETTDGMVVTRIAVNGEEIDLTAPPGSRPRRGPPGGRRLAVRGLDQTVAQISLKDPIAPDSQATLDIAWHTRLPGGEGGRGHRMTQRWDDTLFQPTQWFPRLAKYDDLRGWDFSPYLGPAEFYNNFGRFDVHIDVPAGWIVSATGVLQNPEQVLTETARARLAKVLDSDAELTIVGPEETGPGRATAAGERLVWHYVAEFVNDFAWATAENYVWKATRATIPGKGPIPIHMLHLPEREDRFVRAGRVTRHALEFYSELWMPYAFPQLTLQDGPSAGMEYPMVINSNQGAADHETAHQWWPMMVGTNETWYGWMDEGLNVYMNSLSAAHRRGSVASFDGGGQSYGRMSGNEAEPTMMWVSNYGGDLYGYQTYNKATPMLSMLGGIVGDDAVQEAIRGYAKAWAFKHPSPWDFAFFVSEALERDLGWFWYSWLWTTDSVDGSIIDVKAAGDETLVVVRQDGQMPSPVVLKVEFEREGDPLESMPNATLQKDGSAIVSWPVDVWFEGSRNFEARLAFGSRRIAKITLDPNRRFPDRDPGDNIWPRPPR
ncbi:MAG: M1 family metallopeptidase [Planctomycetes bacterium]|nr:M1 family metallopeptidase [Planctomycetota bacterium]